MIVERIQNTVAVGSLRPGTAFIKSGHLYVYLGRADISDDSTTHVLAFDFESNGLEAIPNDALVVVKQCKVVELE